MPDSAPEAPEWKRSGEGGLGVEMDMVLFCHEMGSPAGVHGHGCSLGVEMAMVLFIWPAHCLSWSFPHWTWRL
jgi:hypothetical protein